VETYETVQELRGHTGAVYCLCVFRRNSPTDDFSPSSRDNDDAKPVLISGGYDRSLRVWEMDHSGRLSCVQTLSRHSGSVSCLLPEGGRVYSGAIDSTIKVWCY